MGQIQVDKHVGGIEGLCVITPTVHGDARGYFMETYHQRDMQEAGLNMVFVQDNQSMSTKGVLRGLHFQKQFPQGKLVRVIRGRVFDVAVDLRAHSATYGKWYGVELTEENKKQFYIPEGFAHGFLVLSETAEFCYKCTDFYHPGRRTGLERPGNWYPVAGCDRYVCRKCFCGRLSTYGWNQTQLERKGSEVASVAGNLLV